MNFNKLVTIIALGLALLSMVCLQFALVPHSWLRFGTSGIFFLLALLIFPLRNFYGPLLFFLLVICDLILIIWDYRLITPGYYLSHILAVSILIFLTTRELKTLKISKVEILSILVFFGINTVIFLMLGDYFYQNITDKLMRSLFYVNGFLMLILVMSAFLYSIRFANDVSAFLFVAVMGLTVSYLLLFGILFIDFGELKYVDNIFYSAALYFLLLSYLEHRKLSGKRKNKKIEPAEAQLRNEPGNANC